MIRNLFVLAVTLLVLLPVNAAETLITSSLPPVFKIAISDDFVPYSFVDKNGNVRGLLVDYWRLWAKKNNHKIEFMPLSWSNTLEAIKTKQAHIHGGLYKLAAREEYIDYLAAIYPTKSNAYIKEQTEITFAKLVI